MPYSDMAITISAKMATNTSAVSYCPRPMLMRNPSPRSELTNSPTTAPITESVAPMRSPPSSTGSAAGNSRWRSIWVGVACSERIRSRRSLGTARMPTSVLTSTGKNTVRAQISTLANTPGNQMISSGATAATGTAWLATR